MKIAITSTGQGLESMVDPCFGRSPYLIYIDPESLEFEAVDNQVHLRVEVRVLRLPRLSQVKELRQFLQEIVVLMLFVYYLLPESRLLPGYRVK